MGDELVENTTYEIPIIKVNVKKKKSDKVYTQYMLKIPITLAKTLRVDENFNLNIEVLKMEKNEIRPKLKIDFERKKPKPNKK